MKKYLSIVLLIFLIAVYSNVFGTMIPNESQLRSGKEFKNQSDNQETISDEELQNLLDETGKPLFDKSDTRRDSIETDVMNERFLNGYLAGDQFGTSVSDAGDVNGDGYDDIVIGAHLNDANGMSSGRVYIYFGGNIFNSVPDVILTGDSAIIQFGISVSTAGDVNGDSYSDVIVGARSYNSSIGRAYIFYGGQNMNNIADVILQGEAVNNFFGFSVSTAGDVNGDGFSDAIVGAYGYSTNTGRAYIYYGGFTMNNVADVILTGAGANQNFGFSVSGAGDVNGDGFSDVIVGSTGYVSNTGRAYIYYGAAAMNNTSDIVLTGEGTGNFFGNSVSNAGDVNGDGYADVIVGAEGYSSNRGRAYIFHGGANMNSTADAKFRGETSSNLFGTSVSNAGDINGDGFEDIIIGAKQHNSNTGRAYIFKGGTIMDTLSDKILSGEYASNSFGASVSGVGDINNDGISDILIGAPSHNLNGVGAGRAFLYMISMTGNDVVDLKFTGSTDDDLGQSVSSAGDVNGDGFSDIIIGADGYDNLTGRAHIFFGGPIIDNIADVTMIGDGIDYNFGHSVSTAGDVNGDGFSDVIVGAHGYNGNTGKAYIFFGGILMDEFADVEMTGAASTQFGRSVGTAGDVNSDGFSDVIVGAFAYSSSTGRAYIFLGGSNMNTVADVTMTGEAASIGFGSSVYTAGDVNRDGFSDVVVSAPSYNTNQGRAYIFLGGTSMNNSADVTMTGEILDSDFGVSVSTAGDVNGDGFSDVIVGAEGYSSNTGRAYIFLGGSFMNTVADVTMTGDAVASLFGVSVFSAGDVNDDGYSDVIVGEQGYSAGKAGIFFGGASMNNVADITMAGEIPSNYATSVSLAGDVNGDGYSDVIVGAQGYSTTGRAYLYMASSLQVTPGIISAKDIPFDQGGKVLLKWSRSGYDVIGSSVITNYLIQRSPPPGTIGYQWEPVAAIPATNDNFYAYSASTYNDSMTNNNGTTFFRVTAQTSNINQYWRSNIMSGYSVDNLAPFAPQNLAGAPGNNSIYLTWNQNEEADLHHYVIYRGGIEIATSVTNNFDDITIPGNNTYEYQVAAVDIHGNVGPLSNLVSVTFNSFGTLNLTVIMEGFYSASLNNMSMSDTLRVYLRNSSSPFAVVDSAKAVINSSTFSGSFQIMNATTGTYYIQTRHRNTIETWSAAGISYTQGGTVSYNFTPSSTQAFGNNMKQVDASPVRFGIYSGDSNQDGIVDVSDLISVYNNVINFVAGYVPSDMNGDDFTDVSDLIITYNNSINFVSVIRP